MLRWEIRRRRCREFGCMRACLCVYVLYMFVFVFVCVFVCIRKDADVDCVCTYENMMLR
jgi:hypothetical protein